MTDENCRLAPEIVEEILYKLPVKSLNRFRCVSKSWQSLISEHRFVRKHLSRAAQPENLSRKTLILSNPIGSGNENLYYFPLSSLQSMPVKGVDYFSAPFGRNYTQLLASYDGLLCVRVDRSVYIWNPSMKTYRKILTPTGRQTFYDISRCSFGLGYDSARDDYKLIRHSKIWRETEMYSLKSDSWKKLNNFPHHYCPMTSVFVNGSFHWLAFDGDLRRNPFAVFSFDLSDNEYGEVPLPECWPKYPNYPSDVKLCVLKGMLCVLVESNCGFVLWAMKDYYSDQKSWTKILDIRFELISDAYCTPVDAKPFYMFDNGEVLMGLVSKRGTELLICKDSVVLFREIIFWEQSLIRHGFVHVESLISISPLPREDAITGKSKLAQTVKNGDKDLYSEKLRGTQLDSNIKSCILRFTSFVLTFLDCLFGSS